MIPSERKRLEADDPGAPPGYLLDRDDTHVGACSVGFLPDELADQGNRLARGAGEDDLER